MNAYLESVGFVIFVIGFFVDWSSVSMLGGISPLSNASIQLLIGAFVAVIGGMLILVGFLSSTGRHSYVHH